MKYAIFLIALAVLVPLKANALICKEVNYEWDASAPDDPSDKIDASGWIKTNLFRPPFGGRTGWFLFTTGEVFWGVHTNAMGTKQWQLDTDNPKTEEDCDEILESPVHDPNREFEANEVGGTFYSTPWGWGELVVFHYNGTVTIVDLPDDPNVVPE